MLIRIAGITEDSIVDGPGLRLTVFVQGCKHGCKGCHNPQTHDPDGGKGINTNRIIDMMYKNPILHGVTLSGGEPFNQAMACYDIAQAAKQMGLNVWCYTGWTWEALQQEADPAKLALLRTVDVLVDGPFVESQRSLELTFCGSRNQRLIDVPKTLAAGEVILWQPKKW
jgi:anaerobic ribonucleoside-triphosphate reductase activating protein